jgi:hypothetical protein
MEINREQTSNKSKLRDNVWKDWPVDRSSSGMSRSEEEKTGEVLQLDPEDLGAPWWREESPAGRQAEELGTVLPMRKLQCGQCAHFLFGLFHNRGAQDGVTSEIQVTAMKGLCYFNFSPFFPSPPSLLFLLPSPSPP